MPGPASLPLFPLLLVLGTVALVIWQPLRARWYGLGPARSAVLGALVAVLSGAVRPADLLTVWHATWNATAALVALIVLSLTLDRAGFFRWAALHVARWGGGSGRRLLALLIVFAALVAVLFANDGGVLILTPIALELSAALSLPAAATLALALAVGFVVDAASVPLTVSNLVNIVAADSFSLNFAAYARVMAPVGGAVVLACLVVLPLYFRRSLPGRYDLAALPEPASAIVSPGVFRLAWVVLPLLLAGYFLADPLGVPLSAVVGAGAAALLLAAARSPRLHAGEIVRAAPLSVVVFSLGMYTVVYGLQRAGYAAVYGAWLAHAGQSVLGAVMASGLSVAALSAGLNNLPAVLFGLLGVSASGATGVARGALLYGAVVGADIGPKLTPIGSLATLLWLHLLAQKGLRVSWGQYLRVGLVLTPPVLLAGLLALWAVLSHQAAGPLGWRP